MFRGLVETIRRDITNVRPEIIRRGLDQAKYRLGLSRTKLRKLGLLPDPWKKNKR